MEAPYFAKGNGTDDDAAAIQRAIDENEVVFLPKGRFAVSKTLVLRSATRLIGLGNIQTVLTPLEGGAGFTDPDHPQPLIETVDDPEAETILGFLKLEVPATNPCVYALQWRAGRNSVVRNVYAVRGPMHPHGTAMNYPNIRIEGSGGGKWFTNVLLHWWDQGPDYRHLSIQGTLEPLSFYMLEPQHGRGTSMVEITDARNIDIFSIKSEGDFAVMDIRNSQNIRIFGYAGNGSPSKGYSLFNLADCRDLLLANINPQHKGAGAYGALGISHDPTTWFILVAKDKAKGTMEKINGTQQFAFYAKGNPRGNQASYLP
jgi:hypothetical protein